MTKSTSRCDRLKDLELYVNGILYKSRSTLTREPTIPEGLSVSVGLILTLLLVLFNALAGLLILYLKMTLIHLFFGLLGILGLLLFLFGLDLHLILLCDPFVRLGHH